jgi:hypothetical protein
VNDGHGQFANPSLLDVPGGANPWGVAIADVDGASGPDIVVTSGTTSVGSTSQTTVLENAGGGTFTAQPAALSSAAARDVVAAQLDSVAGVDLAAADATSGAGAFALTNDGSGAFTALASTSIAAMQNAESRSAGDLTGDGLADAAVPSRADGKVYVARNGGVATFLALPPPVGYVADSEPVATAIADLDRDGRNDIVVASKGANDVVVLLGTAGGFASPVRMGTGLPGGAPSSVTAADFNRDGYLDLAATDGAGNAVSVYLATPPVPVFTPSPVDFGYQQVADGASRATLQVRNASAQMLLIEGPPVIREAHSRDFAVVANRCPASLAPGAACEIDLSFVPGAYGPRYTLLDLPTSAPDERDLVQLNGIGADIVPEGLPNASPPARSGQSNPQQQVAGARTTAAKRCVVPKLKGKTLKQVKRLLKKARCKLGKVKRKKLKRGRKRRVVTQSPKPKKRLKVNSKVNVTFRR